MLRSCLEQKYFKALSLIFLFIISFPEKWILCVGRRYQHCAGLVICIRGINAEQDAYHQASLDVTATHVSILYNNDVCCLSPGHLVITVCGDRENWEIQKVFALDDIHTLRRVKPVYVKPLMPCPDGKSSKHLIFDKVKQKKKFLWGKRF